MRNSQKLGQINLGQILHAARRLSAEEIEDVEKEHQQTGERVGDILLARGLATEYELAAALVSHLQLPYLSPRAYDIPEEVKRLLPAATLSAHQIVPLDRFENVLLIATWGEIDPELIPELESLTQLKICFCVAQKSDIGYVLQEKFPQLDVGQEVTSRLDQLFGS